MLAVSSMSPPVAHYPVVQKRPKLSLQTSELPITYGTSGRGLSTIATPTAAITPTTLNTFNNTYDLTHRPSPTSANASPSILRSSSQRDRLSRSQSPRPKRHEAAYTVVLPYGYKPVLKNTPFPRVRNSSISASPRSSARRVFFPAPKQVHFRNVIEEVIVNKVYTACHSDLFDEIDYDQKPKIQEADDADVDSEDDVSVTSSSSAQGSSITISSTSRRPQPRGRRNSIEFASRSKSTESNTGTATTPSSTRDRRKWEWTLAPIPAVQLKSHITRQSETKPSLEPSIGLNPSSSSTQDPFPGAKYQSNTDIRSESALPTSQSPPYEPRQDQHSATAVSDSQHFLSSSTLADAITCPPLSDSMTTSTQPQPQATSPHVPTQGTPVQQCQQQKSNQQVTEPPNFESAFSQSSSATTLLLQLPHPVTFPTCLTSSSSKLLEGIALQQRRACSLDSSPRKRKAECLDVTGLNNTEDEDVDIHYSNGASTAPPNNAAYPSGSATAKISDSRTRSNGQTGLKRRDRAITL